MPGRLRFCGWRGHQRGRWRRRWRRGGVGRRTGVRRGQVHTVWSRVPWRPAWPSRAPLGGGLRAGARDRGRRWTVGGEQVHDVRPFGFAQRARRGWEVAGPGWRRRGRRLSPCGGRAAGQWVRLVPFAVLRIQCYYWLRMPRHLPVSNKVTTPRGLVVFLGLGVGK